MLVRLAGGRRHEGARADAPHRQRARDRHRHAHPRGRGRGAGLDRRGDGAGAARPGRHRSAERARRSPPASTSPRRRRRAGRRRAGDLGPARSSTPSCSWSTACPGAAPSRPTSPTLDLTDVERIEVLRGSAPVMYGATSFSGVIQVVRRSPAATPGSLRASGGSYGSGGGSLDVAPAPWAGWTRALALDGGHQGFRDDAHRLVARPPALAQPQGGRQGPAGASTSTPAWSTRARPARTRARGRPLSPRVPLDANHNPDGRLPRPPPLRRPARLRPADERRPAGRRRSPTPHAASDALRGLPDSDLDATDANATGFQQTDRHQRAVLRLATWSGRATRSLRVVAGVDFLHGNGESKGGVFDYLARARRLESAARQLPRRRPRTCAPATAASSSAATVSSSGTPARAGGSRAGLRLNVDERGPRRGRAAGRGGARNRRAPTCGRAAARPCPGRPGRAARTSCACSRDYRNTFKPAVFDFGLGEARERAGILKPETAQSYELGASGRLLDGASRSSCRAS